ncbi:MAG: hypothetical protein K8L97_00780 [Anaerolineae bacterium]|nr:hypothetical protein [Anaerolineae bacterium]
MTINLCVASLLPALKASCLVATAWRKVLEMLSPMGMWAILDDFLNDFAEYLPQFAREKEFVV